MHPRVFRQNSCSPEMETDLQIAITLLLHPLPVWDKPRLCLPIRASRSTPQESHDKRRVARTQQGRCNGRNSKRIRMHRSKKDRTAPRGSNWRYPKDGAKLITGKLVVPWRWEHICAAHETLKSDRSRPRYRFRWLRALPRTSGFDQCASRQTGYFKGLACHYSCRWAISAAGARL